MPSFLQVRPQVLSLYVIVTVVVITMARLPLPTFSRRSPERPSPWLGPVLASARSVPVCSFCLFCASCQRSHTSAVSAIDDDIDLPCKK